MLEEWSLASKPLGVLRSSQRGKMTVKLDIKVNILSLLGMGQVAGNSCSQQFSEFTSEISKLLTEINLFLYSNIITMLILFISVYFSKTLPQFYVFKI